MRVAIGTDHAGFELKQAIVQQLADRGHTAVDVGALEYDPEDDYPDFAFAVGDMVRRGEADRGIVLCGSGVGSNIAANKLAGVRACVCHDTYSARQGVEHDDMNVLCLGGRIVGRSLAFALVEAFLSANYDAERRHARRVEKIVAAERRG